MTTRKRADTPFETALKALAKQQAALTTQLNKLLKTESTRAEKELAAKKKADELAKKKAKAKAEMDKKLKASTAKVKADAAKPTVRKPAVKKPLEVKARAMPPVVPAKVVKDAKPTKPVATPVVKKVAKAPAKYKEADPVQSIAQPSLVEDFKTAAGIVDTPVEAEKPAGVWPFPVLKAA